MNLGEKIKQARMNKNYSQEQLANLIFVTKQSISKYENNQSKPSEETIKMMQEVLETSFADPITQPVTTQKIPVLKLLAILLLVTNVLTLIFTIYQGVRINQYEDVFQNRTVSINGLEVTYIDSTYDRLDGLLSLRLHFRNTSDITMFADHMMVSIHNATLHNFYLSETKFNGPWYSTFELEPNSSKSLWLNIEVSKDYLDANDNKLILFYGDQVVTRFKTKII